MQHKKLLVGAIALCIAAVPAVATMDVTVSPTAGTWIGWMNCFDLDGTTLLWGSGWGTPDLPAAFTGPVLELGPNTNTWNPADPYWVTPGGEGNKILEANFYYENWGWLGQTVNFSGLTVENTLDAGYTSQAFIKVLDPDAGWATIQSVFVPLVTGQPFFATLDVDAVYAADNPVVQIGFATMGLTADPAVDHGHVLVVPEPATMALFALGGVAVLRRRR